MSRRLRLLASEQSGLSVVEVVIAALILVISSLAVLGIADSATRNTVRAQASQVVNDRMQHEMEKLKQLPYSQMALTALPSHSVDAANPDFRISGTTLDLARSGAANQAQLVYTGSALTGGGTVQNGQVSAGPTAFTSGGVSGKIYRRVVWQNDAPCADAQCPGSQDYKLLVVDAVLNTTASGGTRRYQEIQSAVPNPAVSASCPAGGCPAGGGDTSKPWTFWLTDTSCNNNTRQPIVPVGSTDGHPSHNTRGVCTNGMHTGNTLGAPDLMFPQPAPLDGQYSSDQQPVYDYATDVEPTVNPTADKGIQELGTAGCATPVGGVLNSVWGTLPLVADILDPNEFKKIHKWVSPAMPTGTSILFNGRGELNLWTKSINGDVEPGSICGYLFLRQVSLNILGIPVYVDTPVINLDLSNLTYFSYSQNPWPTDWTELHIPLHFNLGVNVPLQLTGGDRLGFAMSVNSSGTGASGLQFNYDHPSFDSRLELQTSSVLPIF